MSFFLNPRADRQRRGRGLFTAAEYEAVAAFYESRPDLVPTPLYSLRAVAEGAGIREVLVKDESIRFGLNAFKILGVTYAVHRLIADGDLPPGASLACATAGNHGRAVARAAREQGLSANVYVPFGTAQARKDAIAGEGAEVIEVDGGYEAAVREAAAAAERHGWTVISDTSWPGYESIPRLIMAGYTWMLEEAAAQWAPRPAPDVVIVQAGVGGLACAVASWAADRSTPPAPFVIVCEPERAACVLESVRAGRPVTLEGPLETVMAGLRCGEISPVVWPTMVQAVDAFVSVSDERATAAMRRLARPVGTDPAIVSGASGACGVAALLAIMEDASLAPLRRAAGLGPHSVALVINTEGATDPGHFQSVTR